MTAADLTLRVVLAQLAAEGYLSEQQHSGLGMPGAIAIPDEPTPWYLHAFIAVGAWLAAGFFLVAIGLLLYLTRIETATLNMVVLVLGVVVVLAAIAMRRVTGESVFVINLALAFSLLGQVLFAGGVWLLREDIPTTALAAIIVSIAIIVIYPDRLQRLLSTLVISGALLVLFGAWHIPSAVHPLLWLLALGSVGYWESESLVSAHNRDDLIRPIGYGIPICLLGILGFALVVPWDGWPSDWRASSLGLLVILLGWEYGILSRYGAQADWRLVAGILGGTCLILLPTLPAPGIIAAILVLVTGFRRGNRVLMGLSMAFLVGFFIVFYQNLVLTLFLKSLILLSTGLLCLAVRIWRVRSMVKLEASQ